MISCNGLMAITSAFATDDGDKVTATQTVDVARLEAGINNLLAAGIDSITTTGSLGETSNRLMNKFETQAWAMREIRATRCRGQSASKRLTQSR